jgi:hypothetical protein
MRYIYQAKPIDNEDPGVLYVSIDGDHWNAVKVEGEIGPEDYDQVADIFAVKVTVENGRERRFVPMTFARRYVFAAWGGNATELPTITIPD